MQTSKKQNLKDKFIIKNKVKKEEEKIIKKLKEGIFM